MLHSPLLALGEAVDVEDLAQEVMWPPPRHKLLNLCRNPKHTSVRKIALHSGPRAPGKPSACLTLRVVVSDADLGSPSAWSVRCLRPIVAGPIPCDGIASCCIKVTGHLPTDTPKFLFMASALSPLCFASDFLTLQSSLHACTGNVGFGERERWGCRSTSMTCWLRSFAHGCTNREDGAMGCLLQLHAESLQNDVLSDPGVPE